MSSSPVWLDERSRVTGEARYSADVRCPKALHAAFVLSPEPHARIVSVDTSEAESVPGVEAVLTGQDIGVRRFGRSLRDYPVLAVDRVLFAGQRVAAVAAVDADTARRAAELVLIEYEPLDALLSLDAVLAGEGPVLHPELSTYDGIEPDHPDGNLQGGVVDAHGDVEQVFLEAEECFEHHFSWDRSHQAPLEAHGCLVIAGDERTTVYSSHKEPYGLRRELARLGGRPEEHFVVAPINIGGDFGAKATPLVEAACFFLSERTGRPVRTTMTYLEELVSTSARHPGWLRIRTGLRGGRFRAYEMEAVMDGGAFAGMKPRPSRTVQVVGMAMRHYRVPNADERLVTLYSNNLPGGHVRGPGEFQAVFAGESHLDMIARARGVDPIGLRLDNVVFPETERILHRLQEVVAGWRAQGRSGGGIGISVFDRAAGPGRTRVEASATIDGVVLRIPVPDQGAGMYATFQRIAASTLAVPPASVTIEPVGADPKLTDRGAGASRVTAVAGRACVDACERLLEQLGEVPSGGQDGYWIAERIGTGGDPIVHSTGEADVKEKGHPTFGGLAIELHVDERTGRIEVERAMLVVDGGKVWNPVGYRGQLEGGFVYGLSQSLYEQLIVEDGQVVTASLGDYKLACVSDVPPLEIELLAPLDEDREVDTIRGGVGELSNLGVAPAVANAIDDAVGVRITRLPITSEAVWRGLREERRDPSRAGDRQQDH